MEDDEFAICEVPEDFSAQEPGMTMLPCGEADPTCDQPCDIASMTLQDTGTGVAVAASSQAASDGSVKSEEKKYLNGNDLYIEVVGGPSGMKGASAAKVDILAEVTPNCGSDGHKTSALSGPGHACEATDKPITNGTVAKRELYSNPVNTDGQSLAVLFGRFFDFSDHASDYLVQTVSCGVAVKGEGTDMLRGAIRAVTADTWEVKLKFPSRSSKSSKTTKSAGLLKGTTTSREYVKSTDYGRSSRTDSSSNSSGISGSGATSSDTATYSDGSSLGVETKDGERTFKYVEASSSRGMTTSTTHSGGTSKITKRELTPTINGMKVGLSVTHNGEEFKVLEGINKILNLIDTITKLAEKMVPKVQFGWGFDFKFIEVALYARWGRIAKQKKIGDRVAILEKDALVGLSGTFIFIELSFGIEAQACGFGLVAKLAISGQVDASIEWTLGEGKVKGGAAGTIKGSGTGEVFIDAMFFKGGYKLVIESSLVGKWDVTASSAGFKDSASIIWTGVHFHRIKTGFAAKGKNPKPTEWAKKRTLMSPRPIFTS